MVNMDNDFLTLHPKKNDKENLSEDQPAPYLEDTKAKAAPTPAVKAEPRATVTKVKKGFHPIRKFKSFSTKKKILVVVLVLLLLGAAGTGLAFALKPAKKAAPVAQKAVPTPEAPKPTTEPSKLTGVAVPIGTNARPVTAIMIENSPDARPQSGLINSGVVFEAIAEGGITRFLTLHQEDTPDYIGPVRSVRPYYLDWLQGFDAAVAHAGGSADALSKIKSDNVKDLDQFANANSYMRVNNRYAPHNLYTSMAKMDDLNKAKGYTSSTYDGFPRKEDGAKVTPTAATLDFAISSYLYNAHYDYDAATNTYKRSEGGKPHVDEKSGVQLSSKVVIAIVMNYGIAANGVNSSYNSIGTGHCYIFQDGQVTEGTWTKSDRKKQITFTDAAGAPIKLNAGQTWISAVSKNGDVVYKP